MSSPAFVPLSDESLHCLDDRDGTLTSNRSTRSFDEGAPVGIAAYDTLYASLSYNLREADLTNEEKDFLTNRANDPNVMTQEKKEIIYALCLIDYFKYFPNTKVVFPYKCKQIRDDALELKLDSLPIRLKQILYKFVAF